MQFLLGSKSRKKVASVWKKTSKADMIQAKQNADTFTHEDEWNQAISWVRYIDWCILQFTFLHP